jgi:hypothetical protein
MRPIIMAIGRNIEDMLPIRVILTDKGQKKSQDLHFAEPHICWLPYGAKVFLDGI